jgi:RNA polymerase sigma-32 factor
MARKKKQPAAQADASDEAEADLAEPADEEVEPSPEELAAPEVTQPDAAEEFLQEGDDAGPEPSEPSQALVAPPSRERSLVLHDPLAAYVQEIRRYPLLSREQEHDLAVQYYEQGDLDAARRLVEANLRLVVKIAHEYRRAHRNLLDLVQEGNVGLMQAVKKYDPYRGVKLSSYAAWWIRAYILKFILNNWRLVKIGTTQAQRKLFFNLKKERDKLEREGFAPDARLLAERLQVSEQDVTDMERRLGSSEMSLDAPLPGDDETRTRLDTISGGPRPDAEVEGREFTDLLREKLEAFGARLTGREKMIFEERMLQDSPQTLQEIGEKYGISRERARQLEARLKVKLERFLRAEIGDAIDVALGREE